MAVYRFWYVEDRDPEITYLSNQLQADWKMT